MKKPIVDKEFLHRFLKLDRLDLIIKHLRVVFEAQGDLKLQQDLLELEGRLKTNQRQAEKENIALNQIRSALVGMIAEASELGYLNSEHPGNRSKWQRPLLIAGLLILLFAVIVWVISSSRSNLPLTKSDAPLEPRDTGKTIPGYSIKDKGKARDTLKERKPIVEPPKPKLEEKLIPILLIINTLCQDAEVKVDQIVVPYEKVSDTRRKVYVQGGRMHTFMVGSATQSKMIPPSITSPMEEIVLDCH